MASLTSSRNTVIVGPQTLGSEQPMKAASKVVQGCLVAVDGYGLAADMSKTTGLTCIGIAVESVDNSAGADSAVDCVALTGRFLLDSGTSGDAITQADVGAACYALDNHTVTPVSTGASEVGKVIQLDSDSGQVVVEILL